MEILRRYLHSLHADVYEFWCGPCLGARTPALTIDQENRNNLRKLSDFQSPVEHVDFERHKKINVFFKV